jgi:hypothetical protein
MNQYESLKPSTLCYDRVVKYFVISFCDQTECYRTKVTANCLPRMEKSTITSHMSLTKSQSKMNTVTLGICDYAVLQCRSTIRSVNGFGIAIHINKM